MTQAKLSSVTVNEKRKAPRKGSGGDREKKRGSSGQKLGNCVGSTGTLKRDNALGPAGETMGEA